MKKKNFGLSHSKKKKQLTYEEVCLMLQLHKYPVLDKSHLHSLEHALSRDNVHRVFSDDRSNRLAEAYDAWFVFIFSVF